MNKERILKFFRNPFNILLIILLIITVVIYSKDLFYESIWLDETAYMWSAQLTKENPLYLLTLGNYHLPVIIITIFNLFFKSFTAGRLMGMTFGLLGIILVFIVGKKFKNSFVGFTAAFLLAFNHWYRFLTMKALTDVPTTVMILLFAYLVYLFEKKKGIKLLVWLIIIGIFTLTVKASGIFIIPFVIIYFLIIFLLRKDKKELMTNLIKKIKERIKERKITATISALSLIIIIVLLNNYITYFYKIAKAFIFQFNFSTTIPTLKLLPSLLSWPIIILFILGIIFTIIYKSKELINISLVFVLFLFFSTFFYNRVPELRYILPIILPIYLISAIVIDELINYAVMFIKINMRMKYLKLILRFAILIIILFIVVKPYYSLGNQIIENKNWAYTGYIEAMNWVSDNIKDAEGEYQGIKNVFIPNFFACCSYNAGLERDDIRRVNWSGYFDTFEEFKDFVDKNENMTIYLMPDAWETGQREWLYPMTQEKFDNIISLKFNLVKVVERPYPTTEGIKNIPAVLIFKRN